MLYSLEISNWRSFKSEAAIKFHASREQRFSEQLAKLPPRYGKTRILPTAAVFGLNAAGKTAFFDALAFLQRLVVSGTEIDRAIPREPYRLDPACQALPTTISVQMVIDDLLYTYGVQVDSSRVLKESLSVRRTRFAEMIFDRDGQEVSFGESYASDRNAFIAEGTRANQLFLHNAIAQNANEFRPAYDWFAKSLTVIGTDSTFTSHSRMLVRSDYQGYINERLARYNVGIASISLKECTLNDIPEVPPEDIHDFINEVGDSGTASLQLTVYTNRRGTEIYFVDVDHGGVRYSKMQLMHRSVTGELIPFELDDESKGTQRLIELLPLFFDFESRERHSNSERVYIVDEISSGFHTSMTSDLIHEVLTKCTAATRKQLIFTTHDLLLMDERLLRHDEMWVCDKTADGVSSLICVGSQPGVRTDSRALRDYRRGLFGGTLTLTPDSI